MIVLSQVEMSSELLKSSYRKEQPSRAACLLCALVVTPYFTWLPTPALMAGVGLLYSVLVFPESFSCSVCASVVEGARDILHQILAGVWEGLTDVRRHVTRIEDCLMKMNNITTMMNQLLVLVACDVLFLPGQKFSALYTLMFLNVISYCFKYVSEMLHKNLKLEVTVSPSSGVRHLAMTTTRVVYEWTKAVTFVMTVVSMLLVLGVQRGLRSYHPSLVYLCLAVTYYAASERRLQPAWQAAVERLQLPQLQGMEDAWVPLLLAATCSGTAAALSLALTVFGHVRLALAVGYLAGWLRGREAAECHLAELRRQMSLLSPFRVAEKAELQYTDDVCAVCLWPLKEARVTPCQHMFHAGCLRRCLQVTDRCAICKQELHGM